MNLKSLGGAGAAAVLGLVAGMNISSADTRPITSTVQQVCVLRQGETVTASVSGHQKEGKERAKFVRVRGTWKANDCDAQVFKRAEELLSTTR